MRRMTNSCSRTASSIFDLKLPSGREMVRLKRSVIRAEEALKLALRIAGALQAAHEGSVIHRDLNLSITKEKDEFSFSNFGIEV